MSSSARAELRQFPRRAVGNSQLLTADFVSESGATHHGVVLNLSEGGAAVQLFGTSPSTSVSKLLLGLPSSNTPIETAGEIVWLAPGGRAGVQFRETPPRATDSIREWISTRAGENPPLAPEVDAIVHEMGTFGVALTAILERAITQTKAKSGAIALGDRTSMLCYASIGVAPPVGAVLRADFGLSGFCLQSGEDVFCPDAQVDDRVDHVVAESLNLRSAALLLVRVSGEVAGILELFSDEPNALGPEFVQAQLDRLLPFLAAAIEERQFANGLVKDADENVREDPLEDLFQSSFVGPHSVEPNFVQSSFVGHSIAETSVADSIIAMVSAPEQPPVEASMTPKFTLQPQWTTFLAKSTNVAVSIVVFLSLLGSYVADRVYLARAKAATASHVATGAVKPTLASVALAPNVLREKRGSSFLVDVVVNDAKNVSSVSMEIAHDPKMIKFAAIGGGELIGPSGVIVHHEQKGKIQVTASSAPSTGISGSGTLCTLVFLAKAPGKSKLRIAQLAPKDSSAHSPTNQTSDATITISK
ncbi:MAG TPA: cohesin domain-containing protein [Terriglobales bacterium]